jgi:hypothetical protein
MTSKTKQRRRRPWWLRCDPPEDDRDCRSALAGFETVEQFTARRTKLIATKGNQAARSVAAQLRRCQKSRRCGLSMCPMCARSFRRWLVGALLIALASWLPQPSMGNRQKCSSI